MQAFQSVLQTTWICSYLKRVYPRQSESIGEAALLDIVSKSIGRAVANGLQESSDIRKFAHVAFLLGPNFEEKHSWARKILSNPDFHHSGARLRALEDAAIRHLETQSAAKSK
jgi:hypothetical protein